MTDSRTVELHNIVDAARRALVKADTIWEDILEYFPEQDGAIRKDNDAILKITCEYGRLRIKAEVFEDMLHQLGNALTAAEELFKHDTIDSGSNIA